MNSEEKSQVTAAIEILMHLLTDYNLTELKEESTKPHPIPKGTLIDFATGKVLQNSLIEKAVKKLSLENEAATEDEGGVIELPPELKYGKGTLRKRKRTTKNGTSIFYEGRVFIDGKQVSVTAKTQAECLEKMKALLPKRVKRAPVETLKTWAPRWIERYKAANKASSLRAINDYLTRTVLPALGNKPLKSLTADDVEKLLKTIEGSNTRQKVFDIINGCLKRAVDNGLILKNPCAPLVRPKHKRQRRECFDFAAQNAMIETLLPKYKAVFFFLCCTGLRIGEFLALTYPSDFYDNKIRVCKEMNDKGEILNTTKTDKVRYVPYCAELLEMTFGYNKSADFFGKFTYNPVKLSFTRAMKRASLSDLTIHSTRHTFASMCYRAGIPDKLIQGMLGHTTLAMTMDTYTHTMAQGSSPIFEYIQRLADELKR
jgi:putative integrase